MTKINCKFGIKHTSSTIKQALIHNGCDCFIGTKLKRNRSGFEYHFYRCSKHSEYELPPVVCCVQDLRNDAIIK
jgi:hypothetical protein